MSLERKGMITAVAFTVFMCMALNFNSLASQIIGWIGVVVSAAYAFMVSMEYERTAIDDID